MGEGEEEWILETTHSCTDLYLESTEAAFYQSADLCDHRTVGSLQLVPVDCRKMTDLEKSYPKSELQITIH